MNSRKLPYSSKAVELNENIDDFAENYSSSTYNSFWDMLRKADIDEIFYSVPIRRTESNLQFESTFVDYYINYLYLNLLENLELIVVSPNYNIQCLDDFSFNHCENKHFFFISKIDYLIKPIFVNFYQNSSKFVNLQFKLKYKNLANLKGNQFINTYLHSICNI
jgi:hypothetical protein